MSKIQNIDNVVIFLNSKKVQDRYKDFTWNIPSNISDIPCKSDDFSDIFNSSGITRHHRFFEKMYAIHNNQISENNKRKMCLWMIKKWGGIRKIKDTSLKRQIATIKISYPEKMLTLIE